MARPHKDSEKASNRVPSIGPVRRFGRYTLVKKLATGGMAEIWLARQRGLAGFNRFVVIKKILSHLSEQATFVRMFLDEARTSAQLNHPNIVQIYDLGQEGESYYIAMEFIAGENLAAIAWRGMKRGRPFSPAFAARTIADASKALHYAHHLRGTDGRALEIVHRDISPQNILVTYEGEVKVVDFGIAKAASKSEQTKTGMLKGKFSYMSPEQCLGARVDMRSDIFALGILLYELCTGKRLFKHDSELMILEMITKRTVIPPSEVTQGIPRRLEAIIMRALEKDVAARFQTAQEMQIAIEDYLQGEAHATNGDIASYMRDLFEDKIEEKRRLREIASREDFEQVFASEEATEQAFAGGASDETAPLKRRVVHGLPPSQLARRQRDDPATTPVITGLPAGAAPNHTPAYPLPYPYPNASQPAPGEDPSGQAAANMQALAMAGMTPTGHPSHPYAGVSGASGISGAYGGVGNYPSDIYPPGTLPDPNTTVVRLVIAGALAVIVVALVILIRFWPSDATSVTDPTRAPSIVETNRTGSIVLESSPPGATIYLDGETMRLADGTNAKTPSDVTSLHYGRTYRIKLAKEGFRPFETTIELNDQTDGQRIQPALEAFPGTMLVEVQGAQGQSIEIWVDGNKVGDQPQLQLERPGNSTPTVQVKAEGLKCESNPEKAVIVPNALTRVAVTCVKFSPTSTPPATTQTTRPGRTTSSRQGTPQRTIGSRNTGSTGNSGSAGCATRDDVPPGFVTIDSTPYSEIFWRGKKIGSTPLANFKMPSGCVTIEAVNAEQGKRRVANLKVEPNRVTTYRLKLLPNDG
ncbi:MAG: protein kinase [Deltaproteobacteria bacterium]|nr:protein kinase [Deltaproteobacteria bacterium]